MMIGIRNNPGKKAGNYMPYFGNKVVIEDDFSWVITRKRGTESFKGKSKNIDDAIKEIEEKFGDGWKWQK